MHNKATGSKPCLTSHIVFKYNVLYFSSQFLHNGIQILALAFLARHRVPNLSVSLEVSNCQIQRHFGWWYAIGRGLRMFPQLHVYLILGITSVSFRSRHPRSVVACPQVCWYPCQSVTAMKAHSIKIILTLEFQQHGLHSGKQHWVVLTYLIMRPHSLKCGSMDFFS